MRMSLRASVMLAAAALLIPVTTVTATAAVTNDTWDRAQVVAIGDTINQDTRDAVTEAGDAALNARCGAPAVRGSVWFSYTSNGDEGRGFLVDGMGGTGYDMGLMVFEGEPSADSLVYCGPMTAGVYSSSGTTYYVMAFTANNSDSVGGDLVLTFTEAPPTPQMTVTVDPRGTAFKDGSARLTGTYTCSDTEYTDISINLVQRVGRLKITGDAYFSDLVCDGSAQPWFADVASYNGYFSGGKAAQVTLAFACGALECVDGYAESTIQLRRSKI